MRAASARTPTPGGSTTRSSRSGGKRSSELAEFRALPLEQGLLAVGSPAIAPEVAVRADDAVAGNHERRRVRRAGARDRPGRGRHADASRDVRVGPRLPERNLPELLPHTPLERGRADVERQIEIRSRAVEIGEDARHPAMELAAAIVDDAQRQAPWLGDE